MSNFGDFGESLQPRGKGTVMPNGLAGAKNLDYLPPGWLLSWWLGGLVAHFLETLGACHRHFDGLGRVDVKMHGIKVPRNAYLDGVAFRKTWLKCSKY